MTRQTKGWDNVLSVTVSTQKEQNPRKYYDPENVTSAIVTPPE